MTNEKSKSAREILQYLVNNRIEATKMKCNFYDIGEALKELSELVEGVRQEGYSKGLVEDIGALMMGNTKEEMTQGFEEYKKLKEIDRERNCGYQQAISDVQALFKK